jgi:hypothetical protein
VLALHPGFRHQLFRHHFFQEEGDGAFALSGFAYFGAWGEDA